MDNLFRQTRFSGFSQQKKEESGSGRDRRISPQQTQSFKDKKDQNWFGRQVSEKMSPDYDSNNGDELAIAVAAAAHAISSLGESRTPDQKQTQEEPGISVVTTKRKKEDRTILLSGPDRDYKRFSGESSVSSENQDNKVPVSVAPDIKKPEKALPPAPSSRKTPSLDKKPGGSFKDGSRTSKPDLSTIAKPAETPSSVQKQPSASFKPGSLTSKPDLPIIDRPTPPPAETKRQPGHGTVKSQPDIWEESELARITKRYDKQKSTIFTWEEKKKKKAKRRLDKQERELEGKRAKAMEKYRSVIQYIDQAVGGARSKAEEKKKNDVFKVKEKANKFRKTGKVPKTCLCF